MNLELERFLENQTEMLGNLTITDSIDVETLTDICEEYHKRKLKLLGIADVVGQSEQFNCTCSRAKGLDHDEEGMLYCVECEKPVK